MTDEQALRIFRESIQKVATGPEYSKNLGVEEARESMRMILEGKADPVRAAVFFIALRMKRETKEENEGILQALIDNASHATADVDELVDIADPYDGYTRCVPASAFVPVVLSACGVPSVIHGAESIGPKFGATFRKVLSAAGVNVDLSVEQAAAQVSNPDAGWAYVDQRAFSPALHELVELRERMIKRQVLTTVEVLVNPIRARNKTHFMTGYVHKAYPPIYANLARQAGFDTALIVRGVEGGIIPSLQQPGKMFYYHDMGEEQAVELDPAQIGIQQTNRAVPIPEGLAKAASQADEIATEVDPQALAECAADFGMNALQGKAGATRDSLIYSAATCLYHLKRYDSMPAAADAVRKVLDSGAALARFKAVCN
jgi:anthranilate phosphoribosyltransferase